MAKVMDYCDISNLGYRELRLLSDCLAKICNGCIPELMNDDTRYFKVDPETDSIKILTTYREWIYKDESFTEVI